MASFLSKRLLNKPPRGASVDWTHPLSDQLVAYWLFNEGSGNTVKDLAKYNDLILTGSPTWTSDSQGTALKFASASTQYGTAASNGTLKIDNALGYTAFIDFKITTLRDYNAIITHQATSSPSPLDMYVDSSGTLKIGFGGSLNNVSGILANVRYQLVVVYTRGSTAVNCAFKAYLNGALVLNIAGSDSSGLVTDAGDSWKIATRGDNVTIADILVNQAAIWYKPLQESDVSTLAIAPYTLLQGQPSSIYVQLSVNINLSLGETIALNDSLVPNRADSYNFSEALSLTDLAAFITPFDSTYSDTLALVDTPATQLLGLLEQIASDSLSVIDTLETLLSISLIANEQLSLTDTVLTFIGDYLYQALSDNININDELTVRLVQNFILSDVISIVDVIQLFNTVELAVNDSLSLSDSVSGHQPPTILTVIAHDILSITDSASFVSTLYLNSYLRRYLNDVKGYN